MTELTLDKIEQEIRYAHDNGGALFTDLVRWAEAIRIEQSRRTSALETLEAVAKEMWDRSDEVFNDDGNWSGAQDRDWVEIIRKQLRVLGAP